MKPLAVVCLFLLTGAGLTSAEEKALQCYCERCANSSCTTDGICYAVIQKRGSRLTVENPQCVPDYELVPRQRPFICAPLEIIGMYPLCCTTDYCNKEPYLGTLEPTVITVAEGSDVALPCSPGTQQDIESKTIDWEKGDGQQEVFFYDAGVHHYNGQSGQSEQFKGRVSHFPDQLKNGNASIMIRNVNVADSGDYTCFLTRLQTPQIFYIRLVVAASPRPSIAADHTEDGVLLQCEVRGASPKPRVEWQDGAGHVLPAGEPQVSEREGRYYVTLHAAVTETGHYHCVVTQEQIHHQTEADTYVKIHGENLLRDILIFQ
ncbi:butyrophilin subfamily 2 member A1-like [Etheostoma cragini]|uniref:butyrophilin subfamily 2 member A1-like n=1 Tax=Etheostoma cragini TaxID=417921 RepID=UPI00155E8FAB|nr:butyrophilin subfamily 2 member A1-like [Etheostoma cragini]